MSEVSINVSPSTSTSSFKSMQNVAISTDKTSNRILPENLLVDELSNDFLKYDSQPEPIPTPTGEDEELTGELRELMNENIQLADIETPDMPEIEINKGDNFWLTKEWQNKERHIFILSSSGKPIYSRYGCEDKLATLFGVMQALVSFVQDKDEDRIHSIQAGDMCFSFLSKGYLIVVSASKHRHCDQTLLQRQLLYIYNQIISTLTLSQLSKIFDQHRNFDLRRLLSGSERLIHTLVDFTESSIDFVLSSYRCLPLGSSVRDQISHVLSSTCSKIKNLVFIILIGNNRIISYLHMKKYNLRPMDVHLILNLVQSSESFKTAEIWTPLCLPQFDASGYLYSHVSYLADDCPACLLMLTVDKNLFFTLSEAKQAITEKLRCSKLLDEINSALTSSHLLTSQLNITSLRHFAYKCKRTSQIIVPQVEAPYNSTNRKPSSSHYSLVSSTSLSQYNVANSAELSDSNVANSSKASDSNVANYSKASDSNVANSSEASDSNVANSSKLSDSNVANSSQLSDSNTSKLSDSKSSHSVDSSSRECCAKSVLEYYSRLYCDIHRTTRHLKLFYQSRDTETLLGWTTVGFELYLIFEPLTSKPSATNAVNKLLRWIKKEEEKMFMLNNYTL